MQDLPDNMGRRFASAMAGTTDVPGVWVAGNPTDLTAQVGASAAAGAHINALLATADTDAPLAAAQERTPPPAPRPDPRTAAGGPRDEPPVSSLFGDRSCPGARDSTDG